MAVLCIIIIIIIGGGSSNSSSSSSDRTVDTSIHGKKKVKCSRYRPGCGPEGG